MLVVDGVIQLWLFMNLLYKGLYIDHDLKLFITLVWKDEQSYYLPAQFSYNYPSRSCLCMSNFK